MKPGYKTTELYVAIANLIVFAAVAAGWIKPEDKEGVVTAVVAVISGLGTLVTAGLYIASRVSIKEEEIKRGIVQE